MNKYLKLLFAGAAAALCLWAYGGHAPSSRTDLDSMSPEDQTSGLSGVNEAGTRRERDPHQTEMPSLREIILHRQLGNLEDFIKSSPGPQGSPYREAPPPFHNVANYKALNLPDGKATDLKSLPSIETLSSEHIGLEIRWHDERTHYRNEREGFLRFLDESEGQPWEETARAFKRLIKEGRRIKDKKLRAALVQSFVNTYQQYAFKKRDNTSEFKEKHGGNWEFSPQDMIKSEQGLCADSRFLKYELLLAMGFSPDEVTTFSVKIDDPNPKQSGYHAVAAVVIDKDVWILDQHTLNVTDENEREAKNNYASRFKNTHAMILGSEYFAKGSGKTLIALEDPYGFVLYLPPGDGQQTIDKNTRLTFEKGDDQGFDKFRELVGLALHLHTKHRLLREKEIAAKAKNPDTPERAEASPAASSSGTTGVKPPGLN